MAVTFANFLRGPTGTVAQLLMAEQNSGPHLIYLSWRKPAILSSDPNRNATQETRPVGVRG